MLSSLLKALFVALFLAVYDLWFKNFYYSYVKEQTGTLGIGEAMLGYLIPIALAYLCAVIIARRFGRREEPA